jgi:hypothetical protein
LRSNGVKAWILICETESTMTPLAAKNNSMSKLPDRGFVS